MPGAGPRLLCYTPMSASNSRRRSLTKGLPSSSGNEFRRSVKYWSTAAPFAFLRLDQKRQRPYGKTRTPYHPEASALFTERLLFSASHVSKTELVVAVRPSGESFTLAYHRAGLNQLEGRLGEPKPKLGGGRYH